MSTRDKFLQYFPVNTFESLCYSLDTDRLDSNQTYLIHKYAREVIKYNTLQIDQDNGHLSINKFNETLVEFIEKYEPLFDHVNTIGDKMIFKLKPEAYGYKNSPEISHNLGVLVRKLGTNYREVLSDKLLLGEQESPKKTTSEIANISIDTVKPVKTEMNIVVHPSLKKYHGLKLLEIDDTEYYYLSWSKKDKVKIGKPQSKNVLLLQNIIQFNGQKQKVENLYAKLGYINKEKEITNKILKNMKKKIKGVVDGFKQNVDKSISISFGKNSNSEIILTLIITNNKL